MPIYVVKIDHNSYHSIKRENIDGITNLLFIEVVEIMIIQTRDLSFSEQNINITRHIYREVV